MFFFTDVWHTVQWWRPSEIIEMWPLMKVIKQIGSRIVSPILSNPTFCIPQKRSMPAEFKLHPGLGQFQRTPPDKGKFVPLFIGKPWMDQLPVPEIKLAPSPTGHRKMGRISVVTLPLMSDPSQPWLVPSLTSYPPCPSCWLISTEAPFQGAGAQLLNTCVTVLPL